VWREARANGGLLAPLFVFGIFGVDFADERPVAFGADFFAMMVVPP
jgi:hypothetical protein